MACAHTFVLGLITLDLCDNRITELDERMLRMSALQRLDVAR